MQRFMSKKTKTHKTTVMQDILRLSRGQATVSRRGSRAVPHRLNKSEMREFERAAERGYAEFPYPRQALLNTFTEFQHARENTAIIHEKQNHGDYLHWNPLVTGDDSPEPRLPAELQPYPARVTIQGWKFGPIDRQTARLLREILCTSTGKK